MFRPSFHKISLLVIGLLLLAATQATAAVAPSAPPAISTHILMQISNALTDKLLTGTSTIPGYEGWIELNAVQIGADNAVELGGASGGVEGGKATFDTLEITKSPDTSSTELYRMLARGIHSDEVKIVFLKDSNNGSVPQEYMQYRLGLVMVSSFDMSNEVRFSPEEKLSLHYGKFELIHKNLSDGNRPDDKFGWDVVGNKEWK